jgi:hypothetical protein
MMLVVLSLLDFISALTILAFEFGQPSWVFGMYVASYLIIKAIVFSQTLVSWVDGLVGIWLILLLFGVSSPLSYLAAAWLIVKTVMALF